MPSTTIHMSNELLSKIDQIVKEKGISRNRFIIRACEMALSNHAGNWPDNFFRTELNSHDLEFLREAVFEMEKAIKGHRRNRANIGL